MHALFLPNLTIKQLLDDVFSDIRNNQGRVKCYQPSRRPRLILLTVTAIIQDITKTESNKCFVIRCFEDNSDKHTVARKRINSVLGNLALRAQPVPLD